jgi:hypothetical protein
MGLKLKLNDIWSDLVKENTNYESIKDPRSKLWLGARAKIKKVEKDKKVEKRGFAIKTHKLNPLQ